MLKKWIEFRKDNFTPTELAKILKAFNQTRHSSFRLNTLKPADIGLLEHQIVPTNWSRTAYYFRDARITKRQVNKALMDNGNIYMQSLSSQIPALCLKPASNDHVLDMCAAPGGKTSQIFALMKGVGTVVAIERDAKRYEKLLGHITRMIPRELESSIYCHRLDARKLSLLEKSRFDKILLDAPCSGEGIFTIHEPWAIQYWSPAKVCYYASIQKELMKSAINHLKPGGVLVYSTCTLGPEENENIIQWVLENYPEMRLEDLPFQFDPEQNREFLHGREVGNYSMKKTLRILPNERYEGFFVAKLIKSE
jgi:16S rRNA (cytosine1407-C5)-methyltransferase